MNNFKKKTNLQCKNKFKVKYEALEGGISKHIPLVAACITIKKKDKNYFKKVYLYRILYIKFSQLFLHNDKNVTFFLVQGRTFFHMGISSPDFKKQRVLPTPAIMH